MRYQIYVWGYGHTYTGEAPDAWDSGHETKEQVVQVASVLEQDEGNDDSLVVIHDTVGGRWFSASGNDIGGPDGMSVEEAWSHYMLSSGN